MRFSSAPRRRILGVAHEGSSVQTHPTLHSYSITQLTFFFIAVLPRLVAQHCNLRGLLLRLPAPTTCSCTHMVCMHKATKRTSWPCVLTNMNFVLPNCVFRSGTFLYV